MSSKISKILGVGLVVAVLASLLVAVTPASAGTLGWSYEASLPRVAGAQIYDIAVAGNGTTIYVAGGSTNLFSTLAYPLPSLAPAGSGYYLAKSTNSGTSWATTTLPTIGTGATTNTGYTSGVVSVKAVAVAPDILDGAFVAVIVTDNTSGTTVYAVYASSDGGATWSGPSYPTGSADANVVLNDISISATVSGGHAIALAGSYSGAAKLWVLVPSSGLLGGSAWTDVTLSGNANTTYMVAGETNALSVVISPSYVSDRTIVVVTANSTAVRLQLYNTNSASWNSAVYAGWQSGITVATGVSATSAQVSLPSTYLGYDPGSRLAYVAVYPAASTGGLFRMADTATAYALSSVGMQSVAVSSAGDKLVAGAAVGNSVYRLASPSSTTSTATASNTYKSPGLSTTATHVVVAFAGTNVVAAGLGAESAFAVSTDDGKDFTDVSLANNSLSAKDFSVSSDGSKVYLVSYSTTNSAVSLWKKVAGAWTRILCQYDTTTTDYVVRIAPENSDVIYLAERGGTLMWYSNDGGATSWAPRVSSVIISDMDVASAAVIWVANSGGTVSKSTDSGFTFNVAVSDKALGWAVYMIDAIGADGLVVGGTSGQVAWTVDGGTTWTNMSTSGTIAGGNVVVTADKLATGGNIYAAGTSSSAGMAIYRYTIGTSYSFTKIHSSIAGYTAYGIALGGTTLYVTGDNGAITNVYRTLTPTTAKYDSATGVDYYWNTPVDKVTSNPYDTVWLIRARFTDTPHGLIATVGSDKNPKLWAINTVPGIYSSSSIEGLVDTLTAAGPTVSSPAKGSVIMINTQSGEAIDVTYQWSAVTGATKYQVQIALDSAFAGVLYSEYPTTNLMIFGPNVAAPTSGDKIVYQPDTTYYWRVKVADDGPMDSPYSTTGSFKIGSLSPLKIVSPAASATGVSILPTFSWTAATGATSYDITISDDSTFAIITFSGTSSIPTYSPDPSNALLYNHTYYWRVRASAPATAVTEYAYGSFTTMAEPTTTAPPITVTETQITITQTVPPEVNVIPNYLLWIIIGIGAVLVIALIVLVVRTRAHGA